MSIFEHHSVDSMGDGSSAVQSLRHLGLLYHSAAEFIDTVTSFVDEGLAASQPVMVAVPGQKVASIEARVKTNGAHFVDMTEVGRNPGRVIPAVFEFLEQCGEGPARFVGEPIWLGRDAEEIAEAIRHEALINVAFARFPITVLCPYDGDALPAHVIDKSWQIHPAMIDGGHQRVSGEYRDPAVVYADAAWPLPPPPSGAEVRDFSTDNDLSKMRAWVQRFGWAADLSMDRVDDLVLAVSEVAGNSVRHGGGGGSLTMWCDDRGAVVSEVRDAGRITDPLVGRYPPGPDAEVNGLWLVNQLCDLVEIRSGPSGTRVRLTISS